MFKPSSGENLKTGTNKKVFQYANSLTNDSINYDCNFELSISESQVKLKSGSEQDCCRGRLQSY